MPEKNPAIALRLRFRFAPTVRPLRFATSSLSPFVRGSFVKFEAPRTASKPKVGIHTRASSSVCLPHYVRSLRWGGCGEKHTATDFINRRLLRRTAHKTPLHFVAGFTWHSPGKWPPAVSSIPESCFFLFIFHLHKSSLFIAL